MPPPGGHPAALGSLLHGTKTPVSLRLGLSQAGFGPPSSPPKCRRFCETFLTWSSFIPPPAFPSRPRAGRGAPPRRKCARRRPASARERSREEILPHLHGSPDARVTQAARRQEFVHRGGRPFQ
ncbi:unnamed protein product [Pleuronectes platessa]|uniref:Uncharacterized protein n=1 Tax=Pleuronectes platessa TaxID=8262 RepID=A0A9N7VCR7_PLEPL|nr:unnamed protein product [Pleuronectes platessa]